MGALPSSPRRRAVSRTKKPTKDRVKAALEEVDALNLPDGAHWALVHEKLGLEYGDVFDIIAADPKFFGFRERRP